MPDVPRPVSTFPCSDVPTTTLSVVICAGLNNGTTNKDDLIGDEFDTSSSSKAYADFALWAAGGGIVRNVTYFINKLVLGNIKFFNEKCFKV